jgi:hypothetical protein
VSIYCFSDRENRVLSVTFDAATGTFTLTVKFLTFEQATLSFDMTFGQNNAVTSGSGAANPTSQTSSNPSAPLSSTQDIINFDLTLDDNLGYLDPTAADFLSLIFPGLSAGNLASLAKRDLITKRWSFRKLFKTVREYQGELMV